MIWLFTFAIVPLAVVVMGLFAQWIAAKFVGDRIGRIASVAGMIGYLMGSANGLAKSDHGSLQMIAAFVGVALLCWIFFKRETVVG